MTQNETHYVPRNIWKDASLGAKIATVVGITFLLSGGALYVYEDALQTTVGSYQNLLKQQMELR